jgi:choline-sulfatase
MKNIVLALISSFALIQVSISKAETPSNVILVMCDDLGWGDVGYNGSEVIKTPALDQIAQEGVRFDRFYSASAVCSPTRASCLTGRNPYRTGVFHANQGILRPEELTIAEVLKENGYTTGHFGKWHLGTLTTEEPDANRGGANRPELFNPPNRHGYDQFFVTESKVPTWDPMKKPGTFTKPATLGFGWNALKEGEPFVAYGTAYWDNTGRVTENLDGCDSRVIMDRAVPFIQKAAKTETPFLAVIWFHAPHLPVVAGPEYAEMYKDQPFRMQQYAGCVTAIDDQMKRLRNELQTLGIEDNTMVWFTSDNGPEGQNIGSAGEFRGRKRSFYEGGIRVPGLLLWKNKVQSKVIDTPVVTSDYMPTILDALNIALPENHNRLDGVSILPLLEGKPLKRETPIGFAYPGQIAYTGERYKLYRREQGGTAELYDIVNDPHEERDIAGEHPEKVQSLLAEYQSWYQSCKDSFEGKEYGTESYNRIEQKWVPIKENAAPDKAIRKRKSKKRGVKRNATSNKMAGNPAKKGRPNFLFILVDDQSPLDLKMYNPHSSLDTPTLDRLADEGMVFNEAYHMGSFYGAVCNPSRAMIMTGRTVWRLPFSRDADGPIRDCPTNIDDNTMGALFRKAGYATMRTCKVGNCYPPANEHFEVVHDAVKRGSTDETGSPWHAKQVLNYLDEREKNSDERSCFIFLGFSHPHDMRNGTPELLRKYGATNHHNRNTLPVLSPENPSPKLPVNYLAGHPFRHGHDDVRDEVDVSGVWRNRDEASIRNENGREYACAENIDIQIAKVLKRLEAMGELDNTYIVYTADHGISIGRHGLMGKQNLYQHTWRVPYIVKGPGIKGNSSVSGNIYLLDTLRTMLDLADIPVPECTEGVSFKPVLEGEEREIRDVMYGVYCGGSKPGMRAVKKGDWKLIKYEAYDGSVRETQLFNLAENPDELLKEHHTPEMVALTGNEPEPNQVNLADDPQHADKLQEMESLLLEQMGEYRDPYRFWNQPKGTGTVRSSTKNENAD